MTSVTLNQVTEAITETFVNAWDAAVPYTLEGESFTPPSPPAPWARLTIRNKGGQQYTLGAPGNRIYERKGLIIGTVYTPISVGRQTADTLAQTFKDIFEGTSFSGVLCYGGRFKELGTDGLWFQVAVEIDFMYYETK